MTDPSPADPYELKSENVVVTGRAVSPAASPDVIDSEEVDTVAAGAAEAWDDERPPRRWPRVAKFGLIWLLTLAVVGMAIYDGLRLRRWTWEMTSAIHFTADIRRGHGWGHAGSGPEGYLNLYEKMAKQQASWPLFLDYAPLRLAVMTGWGGYNRSHQPKPQNWVAAYDFNRPVLWFNATMEGIGVLAAFFWCGAGRSWRTGR